MTTPLIEAIAEALGLWSADLGTPPDEHDVRTVGDVLTAITGAGYVVCPREPTEAMMEAASDVPFIAMGNGEYLEPDRADIYRAMISAARDMA